MKDKINITNINTDFNYSSVSNEVSLPTLGFTLNAPVSAVGISPCNKYIISASIDGDAWIWKTDGDDEGDFELTMHNDMISSVAINDNYAITGSLDGFAHV